MKKLSLLLLLAACQRTVGATPGDIWSLVGGGGPQGIVDNFPGPVQVPQVNINGGLPVCWTTDAGADAGCQYTAPAGSSPVVLPNSCVDGGTCQYASAAIGELTITGDAGVAGNEYVGGNLTCSTETVTSETVSTLTVLDDAGIAGNESVGGNLTCVTETVTGAANFSGAVTVATLAASGPVDLDGGLNVNGVAITGNGLSNPNAGLFVSGSFATDGGDIDTGGHWASHGTAPTLAIAAVNQGGWDLTKSNLVGTDADGHLILWGDGGVIQNGINGSGDNGWRVTFAVAYADAGIPTVQCGENENLNVTASALQFRCFAVSATGFNINVWWNANNPTASYQSGIAYDGGTAFEAIVPYHTSYVSSQPGN